MIRIESDHVEANYHRGTVYEKLGQLDNAIADFTTVLNLDPNHVKASYARGACRNLKGEFAHAIGEPACKLEVSHWDTKHKFYTGYPIYKMTITIYIANSLRSGEEFGGGRVVVGRRE